MQAILRWIFGYRSVSCAAADAAAVLNLLQKNRYAHGRFTYSRVGTMTFRMDCPAAEELAGQAEKIGITVHCGEERGFPQLFQRYGRRAGIWIGAAIFACTVWLSTTVVWSVEISGNRRVCDAEILALLSDCGFGVGSRFGRIDFDVFQNEVLRHTDSIAWLAVNMRGTTACVEVRESRGGAQSTPEGGANIVAAEDGQIVEMRVSGGRAAVGVHDVVRKGDLLISGVMSVGESGVRYEYAAGEAIAQVHRRICVESSAIYTEKVYTGEEKIKNTLIFFGKEIKLFQNAGIDPATCDTIIESMPVTLWGGYVLPITVQREVYRCYEMQQKTRSEAETRREAERLFSIALAELGAAADLLSLERSIRFADGVCTIEGDAVCLVDIAAVQEITLTP